MTVSYIEKGYSPVCDVAVLALCIVIGVVLFINRIQRGTGQRLMIAMTISLYFAAVASLLYHVFLGTQDIDPMLIYITRISNHIFLSLVQMVYVLYLREPLWMKDEGYNRFLLLISFVAIAPIIVDILGIVFRFGYYIESGIEHSDFSIYPYAYIAFEAIVFFLIIKYRSRIIKQVFYCLIAVNVISFSISTVQGMNYQTSFTTLEYLLPVFGLLFMFHSNPYDRDTGAANDLFFIQEVTGSIEKKSPIIMICCIMPDFMDMLKNSKEVKTEFFRFIRQTVKRGVLYRFSNGMLMLTVKKGSRGNFDRSIGKLLDEFYSSYEVLGIDYKLIIAETVPEITLAADYVKLFDLIESDMKPNETRRITDGDIKRFLSTKYILGELEDIAKRKDLEDDRVLVYCQPVFNLLTGTYDTAEALMRLTLPDTGLVFPDKFIPIAEKYGLIHQLSLVIMNKTCAEIGRLIADGYLIKRISINFSTLDLKHEYFCDEIQDIIIRNDIPYDKVAIEITESRSESEFNRLKSKMTELQGLGIKFYLDDFGTGYSNFERIMELPFDIIKFDRSLLIESNKNDSSNYMVSTFASMFNDLNYSVLFEGVENDDDEQHCRAMYAKYLQGYKYSKPIPIRDLRNFLEKAV